MCSRCPAADLKHLLFRPLFLLGYIPAHNRIYLADKDVNIFVYGLSLSVIEYQTAILRGDLEAADELLPSIPDEHRNRIARFLEAQGEYSGVVCPL